MKLTYLPLYFLLSFTCLGYGQDTFGLIDTQLDTTFDDKSNITGIGYTIKDGKYKGLKYGSWTEFYIIESQQIFYEKEKLLEKQKEKDCF